MAIPPFPSQDLAKLVLGYLVEEQLMTAYDEFLNESPYLDAQKNEYDRIIMHSLRNILAEYRAVRIYVESCKPIALRKKLFQCTNLLEVVKYLVSHVDVGKLQNDVSKERMSFEDVTTSKLACDTCSSLRTGSCTCNRKRNTSGRSVHNAQTTDTVESIAQTTSLSDLPGNQNHTEGKHVKVLERQPTQSNSSSGVSHDALTIASPIDSNANMEQSNIPPSLPIPTNSSMITTSTTKPNALNTSLECSQNIAEFNTVLKEVYNNSAVAGNVNVAENINNTKILAAGTFRDFTTGVGGISKPNVSVPDSSTTENMILQLPPATCKENKTANKRNCKTQQKKKCSFRIGNVKHDTEISSEVIDVDSEAAPPNSKPDDPKVTILSDIRVGNDDRLIRLPPVLQNATSTPLLQMQTIFINETPIYKPKPPEQKYTFTRDEIMAMPTIILVPASGQSQSIAPATSQPVISKSSCVPTLPTTACSVAPTIQPLTVDVSSSSTNVPNVHTVPSQSAETTSGKVGLVKTVEAIKNASVPKGCTVATSCSTSTPQMQPPTRKSSSTPRRTSHVRVLDFTTPRRILNETINEEPNLEAVSNKPTEIIISKSPNVSVPHGTVCVSPKTAPHIENNNTSKSVNLTEENKNAQQKPVIRKKNNWDADLRALAIASETVDKNILPQTPKPKPKKLNKIAEEKNTTDSSKNKKITKTTTTPNIIRSSKKKDKLESEKDSKKENKMPSSDSVATICESASEKENMAVKQPDKVQNKSNDDDRIDTPEVERLSLQNEIGVKLNISDILETPYKQALYDIQMETPRFLGPDLPDDPMSDIKIMNIPTPRFLTVNTPFTPKPQPTPSSYASRPTDYSSGGSYYKPDDQDYVPILDDINCPVTSTLSKETSKTTSENDLKFKENQPKEKSKRNKNSRPIRQCTKNVSYYKSPMINKNNDNSKKGDISSCSDTVSANSSSESVTVETTATPRGVKGKFSAKSGNKKNDKRSHGVTKNRSPFKRSTQKSFMKIKPRRPTPTKESGKKSRKSSENTQNTKGNRRTSSISKDKVASGLSLVLPVATKSRRKSSTPRKLHCTKTFLAESSDHDSPEGNMKEKPEKVIQTTSIILVQDSDTEQQPLRWSDDGSQDSKVQSQSAVPTENDSDEISQIREYIDKTVSSASSHKETEGSLHIDLIKRGFDEETAKIIERDLLNTAGTPSKPEVIRSLQPSVDTVSNKPLEHSVESDCSALTNNLIIQEDEEEEFSVHECNQDTTNYIQILHDDTRELTKCEVSKLKDKFSMEVCIDDGVVVRLRATPLDYLIKEDPVESNNLLEVNRETEIAVSSISNMDRLYTPMKNSIRDQYYQIFDSTLTSIDTPLKSDSPEKRKESVTEIVSPEDKRAPAVNEITEKRKRKRSQGSTASEDSVNQYKRVKQPFTLNSKEIKDLDIETVLSRLHGP